MGNWQRFESLNKLREKLAESNHDFRATTEIFPSINVDKIASSLQLDETAEENGRNNSPPTSARNFDALERAIVERIQDEQKAAHQTVEDNLQLFSERLASSTYVGRKIFAMPHCRTSGRMSARLAAGVLI